jgi:acyl-CoA reductase-like NAD-dependent aldehyde dehydrogenase
VKLGSGLEPDTQLGPINNAPQFARVQELVEDARRQGGTVVAGGAPLAQPGYFYPADARDRRRRGRSAWSTRSSSGPRSP